MIDKVNLISYRGNNMDMVSYRGPIAPGGVSSALAQLFFANYFESGKWWYIQDNSLQTLLNGEQKPAHVKDLNLNILNGHYRYCNEYLWPLVHDLHEFIEFNQADYHYYAEFNQFLANEFLKLSQKLSTTKWFIHDYQLAYLPKLLGKDHKIIYFWHIPWPYNITSENCPNIQTIVQSLLYSYVIGFHTQEYAHNFLDFVYNHLPECQVDFEHFTVTIKNPSHTTKIVVAPLGIDFKAWEKLSSIPETEIANLSVNKFIPKIPYILSVDRADYTKGLYQRIQAIQYFFENYPEFIEKLTFIQLSGKTRPGLKAFDNYFAKCKNLCSLVNSCWGKNNWQPITWIEQSFTANELAIWYRKANIMLVNPVRDGLNLTAKEYIACQTIPLKTGNPGMLNLSSGAGTFTEIGKYTMFTNFMDPQQIAQSIYECLKMTKKERAIRMDFLSEQIASSNLIDWWLLLKNNFEKLEIAKK